MTDKTYILHIKIDGEDNTMLTYASTPENAIDNAVMIESVEELYKIVDQETQHEYKFNIDIQEIRKVRKLLPADTIMDFKLHENR